MNITTIIEDCRFGGPNVMLFCFGVYQGIKKNKEAARERQARQAAALPKPKGCTDQRYTDPEKELRRFMHKIACV